MTKEQFVYRGKGAEYWRARAIAQGADFGSVVDWAKREQGLSTGRAINLARKLYPAKYNQWMSARACPSQRMMRPASVSPVTTLSRPRPGGPFITFRGL
jgi:hypothetical protein